MLLLHTHAHARADIWVLLQVPSPFLAVGVFGPYSHLMIEGHSPTSIQNVDANQRALDPTNYGLGRGAVTTNLASFRIVSNSSGRVNTTLSSVLQAPYQGNAWVQWAQHFCAMTCYRDAQLMQVQVRTVDFVGYPLRTYLNRQVPNANGAAGTGLPIVNRCVKCPPFQATLTWTIDLNGKYVPADPRDTYSAGTCVPWFGSVPLLKLFPGTTSYTYVNSSHTDHSGATDGVLYPTSSLQIPGVPCPVNTYNDRCADYFLLTAQALVTQFDTVDTITVTQPQCMPCPAGGYHTGGQIGAWFCLPPLGQTALIESTYDDPLSSPTRTRLNLYYNSTAGNGSLAWARRDILGYEWECGISAAQCYQCASVPGAHSTWTPVQFNEQLILPNLLRHNIIIS